MPRSITIRTVPDEIGDELAARAARTGRSAREYLRSRLVQLATIPDPEVSVASLRARKKATGGTIDVQRVLAHRDAERR